jgi:PKD repeat protein
MKNYTHEVIVPFNKCISHHFTESQKKYSRKINLRCFWKFCSAIFILVILFCPVVYSQCSVTGSNSVCAGDIDVYQTSFPGSNFLWSVVGGSLMSSYNGTATVAWGPAGSGSVSVQIEDFGQNILAICSLGVTINSDPSPIITADFITECVLFEEDGGIITPRIDPGDCWKVCESTEVVYSTPLNAGSIYVWEAFGSISVSSTSNINEAEIVWGVPGIGLVRVTETTASGCSSTTEHCITIVQKPAASLETVPVSVALPNGDLELTVCLYENITFKGYFSAGNSRSPVMNWLWIFDDGEVSVEQNPKHFYSQPGTYRVQLIVTNQCGCQDEAMVDVIVNDLVPPTIECPSPVCANDTSSYYTFANCDTYLWSVTNGTILSTAPYGSSIVVRWDNGNAGPGVVTLQTPNCNDYCDAPTSIEVPILFQGFSIAGATNVCVNQQVKYSVPLIPGTEYIWDLPGASTIIGQYTNEVLVEWNSTGSRTIRVDYVNDFLGCDGFSLRSINVKNDFEIAGSSAEICDFGQVSFSTTPSGVFNWSIQDAATNVVVQSINSHNGTLNISSWPHGSGTYKVSAFAPGYCTWQSVLLTVRPGPPAPSLITGDLFVCPNTPHLYSAPPTAPDYFIRWFVTNGDPLTMEGNEVTVTWGATGLSYSLFAKQVDMLTGCESEPSAAYNVQEIVAVPPNVNVPTEQCVNSIITYSISNSIDIHADDIQWEIDPASAGSVIQTNNGGLEATIQWNATVNPLDPMVDIRIRIFTCGSEDLSSPYIFSFELIEPPSIEIQAVPEPVCDGSDVTFSVLNLPAGIYTYLWTFPNGTSTVSSPTIYPDRIDGNIQDVSVVVTDIYHCPSIDNIKIYVNPNPGANIIQSGLPFDCPNYTLTALQVGPNYEQSWGNGATTPSITVSATGFYNLDILDITTGCFSSTQYEVVCPIGPIDPPCNTVSGIDFSVTPVSCNEISISLNAPLPGGYSNYAMYFGDGGFGPFTTTSHSYSLPGIYSVCIQGDDGSGGCGSKCHTVDLSLLPDFDYAFECIPNPSALPGCTAYYAINVFDKSIYSSSGTQVDWTWSNASGTIATGQHPNAIPLCSGSQNITLTLSKGSLSCSKVLTIVVPDPPVPAFTVSSGPVCEGFTPVQFTYSGTLISNLATATWFFDDGASSELFPIIGPQTERVYEGTGLYFPTLTVFDQYGCSYSSTQSTLIDVNENDLNASYDPNTTIKFCPGGGHLLKLIQFAPSNPDIFIWSNGATSSQIWVTQTGEYLVTMSSSVSGCEYKVLPPAHVAVDNLPIPFINGELEYCDRETIYLNSFLGAAYTYDWTVTLDGQPFTGFNQIAGSIEIPNAAIGTYLINVNLSSSGITCTTSNSVSVIVHPNPDLPIILSSVNPACEGEFIELYASNAGLNYVNWSNGASGVFTQVYNSGVYRATYTNEGGCTSFADFIVHPEPDFSFILSGCFDYCSDDDITIPGDRSHFYESWEWQITSAAGTSIVTGNPGTVVDPLQLSNLDPGHYSIQLYALTIDGCESYSDPIDLSIKSCECPLFGPDDPEIKFYCLFESAGGIIYNHTKITLPPDLLNSDCIQSSTTALIITSPDGTFTPTIGFPNNPMEGIFVPYTVGLKTVCFEFNLVNSEEEFAHCNCLETFCAELPQHDDCPYLDECEMQINFDEVSCTEGGTPNLYQFTMSIISNSDLTVWFSASNGTLTGMPQSLSTGLNVINGLFSLNSPPYDMFCITVNGYDVSTDKYCQFTVCYEDELPDCIPYRFGTGHRDPQVKSEIKIETSLFLSPNPAFNSLKVSYRLSATKGVLKVLDTRGREIFSKTLTEQEGFIELNTTSFNRGVYWVRVESDSGESKGAKLLIIK